jgi:hypothetical protein
VQHQQDPREPFDPATLNPEDLELDILYPLKYPDVMSSELNKLWTNKQKGGSIKKLQLIPTYKNDGPSLLEQEEILEKKMELLELKRQTEHKKTKVFSSVRQARGKKVAAQRLQNSE